MRNKNVFIVDTYSTDVFRADLLNDNSVIVMVKKDENYFENFNIYGALGIVKNEHTQQFFPDNESFDIKKVFVGFAKLATISDGMEFFKNIQQIFECLKDYVNFIGWEKIDKYTETIEGKLILNSLNKDILERILASDKPLKDKWCGITSAFRMFAIMEQNKFSNDEIFEMFMNRPTVEEIGIDDSFEFESCSSYMFNFYPIPFVSSVNFPVYKFLDENFMKHVNKAVAVVNEPSVKKLSDIDFDKLCHHIRYRSDKTDTFIFCYALFADTFEKDQVFLEEVHKGLTNVQLIDLIFSMRLVSFHKNDFESTYETVCMFQKDRIAQGLKPVDLNIDSDDKMIREIGANFSNLFDEEEYERFKEVYDIDASVSFYLNKSFKLTKYFIENPDSFIKFAHDYSYASDTFNNMQDRGEEVFVSKRYLGRYYILMELIKQIDKYENVFRKFMKNPDDMPFSFMLIVEGVIDSEDYLKIN